MRPDAVAHEGQARAYLRHRQRRGFALQPHVVEPAQARQIALAGLGHVVKGIGGRPGAALPVFLPQARLVDARKVGRLHLVADRAETFRPRDHAEGGQRARQRVDRHIRATRPGLEQEIDDIGPQPGVSLAVADSPKTERTVESLAVEQLGDRSRHRAAGPAGRAGRAQFGRIKQRQGGRDQLLAAAIGIASQGRDDRSRIEVAERRIRHRQTDGPGGEPAQQAGGRGIALAGSLQRRDHPQGRPPAQPRLQGIAMDGGEARSAGPQVQPPDARRGRRDDLDRLGDPLAGGQDRGPPRRQPETTGPDDVRAIQARAARDIVQFQRRAGVISRGQEARQRQLGHHRLAHRHLARPRAHRPVGPGDRHQPQLSVEFAGRQANGRVAAGVGVDDARPQGDGFRRHHGQARAAELVAAEIDRSGRAEVRIEQTAVVVAVAQAQGPFAEIPADRIGVLLVREAQHALVDRRQRHVRPFPAPQALDGQRHGHRRLAVDDRRRRQGHRQFAPRLIHRHIDQSQRAAWLWTEDRIARLHHRDHHIGPADPVGPGLEPHRDPLLRYMDRAGRDQVVGGHRHLGLAGERRGDAHLHGVADPVAGPQRRHPRRIGRFDSIGRLRPAGALANDRAGAGGRVVQLQAIIAPGQFAGDPRRRARADTHDALGDRDVAAAAPPGPAAVLLEPVVGPGLGDQPVVRPRDRHAAPARVDGDEVEGLQGFLTGPRRHLHAEIQRSQPHLEVDLLADRTAARLEHRGGELRQQRLRRAAQGIGAQFLHRVARPIGHRRRALQQLLRERRLLVTPAIILERRKRRGIGDHPALRTDRQRRGDRAIQEPCRDLHGARLARQHGPVGVAGQSDRQSLGHEILNLEGHLSGGSVGPVHFQAGLPDPARGGGG